MQFRINGLDPGAEPGASTTLRSYELRVARHPESLDEGLSLEALKERSGTGCRLKINEMRGRLRLDRRSKGVVFVRDDTGVIRSKL